MKEVLIFEQNFRYEKSSKKGEEKPEKIVQDNCLSAVPFDNFVDFC